MTSIDRRPHLSHRIQNLNSFYFVPRNDKYSFMFCYVEHSIDEMAPYSSTEVFNSKKLGTISSSPFQFDRGLLYVDRGVGSPMLSRSASESTVSNMIRLDSKSKVWIYRLIYFVIFHLKSDFFIFYFPLFSFIHFIESHACSFWSRCSWSHC